MTIPFRPATARANATPVTSLTLVVPCYNEELRLRADSFLAFVDETPRVHVLFVNDGSRDGTLTRLQQLAEARPAQISVLDLPRNGGKAEAVRAGLKHALDQGAQMVAYWDADLATPLELVEDFLRVADRNPMLEVVFGSRRRMLGHQVVRTLPRRAVSRICAMLARMAIGLPVADTQCGAKLLRSTPAVQAAVAQPFTAGWLFDVELFARIARLGGKANTRFYELPLSEWHEIPGSKVSASAIAKSGLRMLRLIAELRLTRAAPVLSTNVTDFRKAA
ncbi:glycosyltransferase [Nioella sp.]|uniref:glycosyltransferase n=1 Tax=Nioella sp. TaxID=1912091 RepID=UPI00351916D8